MRVKCLAQEHNTMSPARARTRTAHSGIERTNDEATAPLTNNNNSNNNNNNNDNDNDDDDDDNTDNIFYNFVFNLIIIFNYSIFQIHISDNAQKKLQ